jgi:NAD(P)H-flavin reductase
MAAEVAPTSPETSLIDTDRTPALRTTVDAMIPRIGRIRSRRRENNEVWTLDVRDETAHAPAFRPGQFNMVTVFGVGEIPISFSGDPRKSDRLIHTVRSVGPVSTALTRMRPGEVIGLRGPFGSGWPIAEAAGGDILVVAGGLGLAPLRPLLYELRAERKRYGRIVLLYGARSPDDMLFRRETGSLLQKSNIEAHSTVDHAGSGWTGNVGVVTTLVPKVGSISERTTAFVCGPEVMMRMTISALQARGVQDTSIYLSMERNMKCAAALCGRCQFGSVLVCRDGPVFRYDRVRSLLKYKEL